MSVSIIHLNNSVEKHHPRKEYRLSAGGSPNEKADKKDSMAVRAPSLTKGSIVSLLWTGFDNDVSDVANGFNVPWNSSPVE